MPPEETPVQPAPESPSLATEAPTPAIEPTAAPETAQPTTPTAQIPPNESSNQKSNGWCG